MLTRFKLNCWITITFEKLILLNIFEGCKDMCANGSLSNNLFCVFYFFGYLYMKNFKYSILKDFILVIRQSDGPAIWGGCVPAFFPKKRDGALFAVQVQSFVNITRVAPAPLLQIKSGGTILIGAGKLSRYRMFVGGTGAVSRYKQSRSQKTVMMQDLNFVQMSALTALASAKASVRVHRLLQICLECSSTCLPCLPAGRRQAGKQKPSRFFRKKRETTYPYCPC